MDMMVEKFAVGQPVSRKEDPALLRGEGRYSDDASLPGQAYAVMVRSRYGHGRVAGVETAAARGMAGVLAVYAGGDLAAAGVNVLPKAVGIANWDGSPMADPRQSVLAVDRVRYVGEPVAVVVAETAHQARDAAEAVVVDVAPLPAVVGPAEAAGAGAPQLHEGVAGNVCVSFRYGDAEKVEAAFKAAAHVAETRAVSNRIVVSAMEPRSAIGSYEEGRWVLRMGCQGVWGMRRLIAETLGAEVGEVRVLTGNVGGSFGMKASVYPEYVAILHAARALGRPVKWTDERSESFLSDSHGRDHEMTVSGAFDAEGRIQALRVRGWGNCGAYLSNFTAIMPTMSIVKNIVGVYRTPLLDIQTVCVFTNTTPIGAYRGAGRPEGNFYIERLMDTAAREMGIDRVAIRERNHIRPEMMPYSAPSGSVYDCGDFPAVLARGLEAADWAGFDAREAESRGRGMLRGRGIGQYLEVTAAPSNEMGGILFGEDGRVTIVTGTLDYGQGHASAFAQVLADRLGVPFELIDLVQGDSDLLVAGGGTGGSKSIMASGGAIVEASGIVVEKGRELAGEVLEAAAGDVEFAGGRFVVAGTDRGIGIMELAARAPGRLDVRHIFKGSPAAYPNGCHIAEVEVDPATGVVRVVKYTMMNDFGVEVNPMLVAGQAHGGVVQGIGQALMERVAYDGEGQMMSGSYMDYAIPRASEAPSFAVHSHPVPTASNALGVKGCGEAGCAGSLPAVVNALADALAGVGVGPVDMPATPMRVWEALRGVR